MVTFWAICFIVFILGILIASCVPDYVNVHPLGFILWSIALLWFCFTATKDNQGLLKKGERVICVSSPGGIGEELTVGKKYKVIHGVNAGRNSKIAVINNQGFEDMYYTNQFQSASNNDASFYFSDILLLIFIVLIMFCPFYKPFRWSY